MGRQAQEEVAAAAHRRLELLRRELDQAGLRRVDGDALDPSDDQQDPVATPASEIVTPVGRHARGAPAGRARTGQLGSLLPETLRGRTALSPGPLLLVIGLVAVAVVVTAIAFVRMHDPGDAVPAATARSSPLVSTAPGAVTAPSTVTTSPPAGAGNVTVDIAGKVRRPGVRTLPSGSRVIDALKQAGGAKAGVDLTALNLARVLADGEQILVGAVSAASPGGKAGQISASAPPLAGAMVNLNTASESQLDTLPGVGPVTAQKILQWRAAHGAFSAVDELLEVDGIGDKTLADLAPLVTL